LKPAASDTTEDVVGPEHGTQLLRGLKVNIIPVNAIVNDEGLVVGKLNWGEPGELQGRSINDQGEILDDDGNAIGHVGSFSKPLRPEELGIEIAPPLDEPESPLPGLEALEGLELSVSGRILGAIELNSRGAIINDDGELVAELTQGDLKACTGKVPDEKGGILDTAGTIIGKVTFLSEGEGIWHEREASVNAREGESSTTKLFTNAKRNLQDLLATHAFTDGLNDVAIGLDDALLRMKLWASEMDVDEVTMDALSTRSPYLAMADQMLLRVVLVNTRRLDALLAESEQLVNAEEVAYRLARKIDRAVEDLTRDLTPYRHTRDLEEERGPATAMKERLRLLEERPRNAVGDVDAMGAEEPAATNTPKVAATIFRSPSAARAVPTGSAQQAVGEDDTTSQRPIPPPPDDDALRSQIRDADGNSLNMHEFVQKLQQNNEILMRWVQDREASQYL
jgi:hypothetical protein